MARRELRASILPADGKGLGAFASESIPARSFVCSYKGEALTRRQFRRRYADSDPVYGFRLSTATIIDGRNSSHYSRYINHDENGNLRVVISSSSQIDFYAARRIVANEELSFDYGPNYWLGRDIQPAAGTECRATVDGFSFDRTSLPQKLPPRAPLSAKEASIALSLPRDAGVAWLQSRCHARGQCISDRTEVFRLQLTSSLPRMQRRIVRRALALLLGPPPTATHIRSPTARWESPGMPALHARAQTFLQSRWAEALTLWASFCSFSARREPLLPLPEQRDALGVRRGVIARRAAHRGHTC